MRAEETVSLKRDCIAVTVPTGHQVLIPEDSEADIVQSLGGSFTIRIHGRLFRVDGKDADALGKDPLPKPELAENASDADVEKLVWEQLKTCYDPEIPIDIVELGLVYSCSVHSQESGRRRVDIEMTLTAPGCGMGDVLAMDIERKLLEVPTVAEASVEVVFDPPWNASMMSDSARLATGMF
jgi:probable FeS assembly SUF system protein SufT